MNVSVQLVQAKARVAPLKRVTIPRLELLACCVGARLANSVKADLPEEDVTTFYWSDSNNALWWIKTEDSWGTFVWNRVREIRALSDRRSWRHVPGNDNPADLPSRGCTAQKLLDSRWFEGPHWLRKDQSEWPQDKITPDKMTVDAERKFTVVSSLDGTAYPVWSDKFSSYWRIVRVLAWIYRFFRNSRPANDRTRGVLTLEEINYAEIRLLRTIQKESFQGQQDETLRSLELFIDPDHVLRVKTRMVMREDTLDYKYPVVLPSKHPLVVLLVEWTHKQLCHGGVQIVMSKLRERYWILKGRRVVKQVVRQCKQCRRYGAKRAEAAPAPLPQERVRDSAVFETTGIDLAGPLTLKGGGKVWIVLFTCAVYRAVHLELVTTLSTEGFFQTFRRFVARRGRPATIFSDNGTNFVGADNAFKAIDWNEVGNLATLQRIKWKFNPPTAAWWGGWWERLIGMLKGILRRVLGRASLSYEEFSTVLCDSEWIMNSRPLTYLSEDNGDLVSLSPAAFLWDLPEVGVPDVDAVDHSSLNKRQQYRQRLREELRQRFRVEYLGQLKQKRKKASATAQVAVGDVMLIGSDNSKRLDWPFGRVIEVIPGRDGQVRVCRLRTAQGELLRPVQRLFPMEVTDRTRKDKPRDPLEPSKDLKVDRVQITRSGRRVRPPDRLQL